MLEELKSDLASYSEETLHNFFRLTIYDQDLKFYEQMRQLVPHLKKNEDLSQNQASMAK